MAQDKVKWLSILANALYKLISEANLPETTGKPRSSWICVAKLERHQTCLLTVKLSNAAKRPTYNIATLSLVDCNMILSLWNCEIASNSKCKP